jgi:hypothetical protein
LRAVLQDKASLVWLQRLALEVAKRVLLAGLWVDNADCANLAHTLHGNGLKITVA